MNNLPNHLDELDRNHRVLMDIAENSLKISMENFKKWSGTDDMMKQVPNHLDEVDRNHRELMEIAEHGLKTSIENFKKWMSGTDDMVKRVRYASYLISRIHITDMIVDAAKNGRDRETLPYILNTAQPPTMGSHGTSGISTSTIQQQLPLDAYFQSLLAASNINQQSLIPVEQLSTSTLQQIPLMFQGVFQETKNEQEHAPVNHGEKSKITK